PRRDDAEVGIVLRGMAARVHPNWVMTPDNRPQDYAPPGRREKTCTHPERAAGAPGKRAVRVLREGDWNGRQPAPRPRLLPERGDRRWSCRGPPRLGEDERQARARGRRRPREGRPGKNQDAQARPAP